MLLLHPFAPLEIAGATRGRRRPRHGPSSQVMAARREQQRVTRIGPQRMHPFADEPRVQQFLRAVLAANRDLVRILRVGGVDRGQREFEPRVGHAPDITPYVSVVR